eukprot:9306129-Lingulodinium_polyedra.AAC.1
MAHFNLTTMRGAFQVLKPHSSSVERARASSVGAVALVVDVDDPVLGCSVQHAVFERLPLEG